MRPDLKSFIQLMSLPLLAALLALFSTSVLSQAPVSLPVNIYGDGNPENGIEDSREQLMGGRGSGIGLATQSLNAGSIMCDGKIRGTAMVLDTRELEPALEGVLLATAAHVLFDLERKRLFKRCEFHFLALGELPRYRAKIDLGKARFGRYDPGSTTAGREFGQGDWAYLYLARPWKNFNPAESIVPRDFNVLDMAAFERSHGEIRLVAFDSTAGVIAVSRNCRVIESTAADLGGGAWRGQLLDDCDSAGGASGGGIVAVVDNRQYLVGIRSGSHWSNEAFPADQYPLGPPDGSVWNPDFNTNFGRAIDSDLMRELIDFIQEIKNTAASLDS
jgi:hypothetical protein